MSLSELLTISIASKDRPDVVEATLRKIHAFGLGGVPLILCDDGSSPPLDPPALGLFPHGKILRKEVAQGQAGARNRIAKECSTPYLLQLDDDSYPVAGSIDSLLSFAERTADWIAIAIPFEEPARGRGFPVGIPSEQPIQVKSFVGCSALLHVERFRNLGGYASWISRTVEEEEFSIRAIAAGFVVVIADGLRVRHDVSEVARDRCALSYRSIRNWSLVWLIYSPIKSLPLRLARLFAASIFQSVKQVSVVPFSGFLDSFCLFRQLGLTRSPISIKAYKTFRRIPHAIDFWIK